MRHTILAIDDDPIILDMYQAILDEDYNLRTVSSGREALDFLVVHPRVDLILSDIMMPQMDGYEVCRRIRENPSFSHVKIILVSSNMLLDDRLRGYAFGADDYITKPFEGNELLAKVKVFLRLKNAEEIDKIKSNLITLLSHEARTPLTIILGCAELLQESPNLSKEQKYFIEKIVTCGRSLSRSSEKAILLSDLKSGNIRIEREKIQLQQFLAESQAKFTQQAAKKNLTIHVQMDVDHCIDADQKLLELAVDALLDNATKFAYQGSIVELTVNVASNRIQIEIANEGDQIPLERRENIFDELSVQDIEHHQQGYGLSLALARRICEAHEGSLSVKNRDTGPSFVIDIKS